MQTRTALTLLDWQIELGADEAIGNDPVNRFDLAAPKPLERPGAAQVAPPPEAEPVDAVKVAEAAAAAATDLAGLRAAMADFELCDLKRGARNLVFADGRPDARVMVIGEAPGRDEDLQGKPFVGRAGQMLDRMFEAIGLSRAADEAGQGLYITNVLPWRPPQNRDPSPEEIAMLMPFVARHVALAEPEVIVAMGNHACQGLLGRRGITRMRGAWAEALGKPILPMFHPAYLLRMPSAKREAWHDLLMLQARLRDTG